MNRRESAFTIVEVIVAGIIVAIVVAAAGVALAGALNGKSRAKVTSRGQSVASAVLRKMQADTSWLVSCSTTAPGATCDVPTTAVLTPGDRLTEELNGTVTHTLTITATAVDLAADQLAENDLDSRPVDIFRIHVENRVTGAMLPAAGVTHVADGVINPSVRGRTGVVRLRMCAIDRQIDERIGTGLCATSSPDPISLKPPLASSCAGAAGATTNQVICLPWNAAEAADAERYTSVRIRPMGGATVQLRGPLASEPTTRSVTTTSSGSVDVRDLAPGQYEIIIPSPLNWNGGSWVGWSSHSVPSSGNLIVEKDGLREATIMMRPAAPPVTLRVQTLNRTNPQAHVIEPSARYTQTVRLLPIPDGRSLLERGTAQNGWTQINVGDSEVTLRDSHTGVYSNRLMHYPRGDTSAFVGGAAFVWIDPDGTTVPSTLVLQQDYCDKAARHAILVATCGAGVRWCYVGATRIDECNDNPVPPGGLTTGAGGA